MKQVMFVQPTQQRVEFTCLRSERRAARRRRYHRI
jgi:hypothetical protein